MSSPWADIDRALEPADQHVGPFPRMPFLEAWWRHLGEGEPVSVVSGVAAMPLVADSGVVRCAGAAGVTDYHSPLGDDFSELAALLVELSEDVGRLELDSLPEVSATRLQQAFVAEGRDPTVTQDEATAVIVVEDEYLDQLSKKQRHEVRRKHRRFAEAFGEPEISHSGSGAFERFVQMHQQSQGEKGSFLQGPMEGFFAELAAQPGWGISEMMVSGQSIAAFFGFRGPDAYYLYNSAFDPDYREVSPGIVALYLLIEELVDTGCRRIDLLKGDEIYKSRMGAARRPLHTVVL